MGYRSSVFMSIVIAGKEDYDTLLQKILNMAKEYPQTVDAIAEAGHTQQIYKFYALNFVMHDIEWHSDDDGYIQKTLDYLLESELKFRFEFLRIGEEFGDVDDIFEENMSEYVNECPFSLSSKLFQAYMDVDVDSCVEFGK